MPQITRITDPQVIQNVGESILESVVTTLRECNIDVPARRYVGFCEPPQDCCPDLVVWPSAIRPDDSTLGNGLTRGYFVCNNLWSVDYNIRIGHCYVDTDSDGRNLSADELNTLSREMHERWYAVYIKWLCQASNGGISEIAQCDHIFATESRCYAEGGCAGFEFTITVPLIN